MRFYHGSSMVEVLYPNYFIMYIKKKIKEKKKKIKIKGITNLSVKKNSLPHVVLSDSSSDPTGHPPPYPSARIITFFPIGRYRLSQSSEFNFYLCSLG